LSDRQIGVLEAELAKGPAAHGWDEDQRWTLARIAAVIRELFGRDYTLRGVSYLLHRIGWSPQVPVHRAAERDEEAINTWVKETWPRLKQQPPPRGSVDLLRRRIRAVTETTQGPHLGTTRPDADRHRLGQGVGTGVGRRADLRQRRAADPPDLLPPSPTTAARTRRRASA
jgi:hypothetical protein